MGGWPVDYLHNAVEEFNSGLPRTIPDSRRMEDLNQGPSDFKSCSLNHSATLPPDVYRGAFHSTKYSGLKFRVFHATNGTVFSGSLNYPIPGHQVPSFARKYEIKRMALLSLFTCFGVARRL